MGDAPYNTRNNTPSKFKLTVCAICNTLCNQDKNYVVRVQQVLGCIGFDWQDRGPAFLTFKGATYTLNRARKGILAEDPVSPWAEAVAESKRFFKRKKEIGL
jgi:hypothetical protein